MWKEKNHNTYDINTSNVKLKSYYGLLMIMIGCILNSYDCILISLEIYKHVLNMKYAIFCLENNVDIDKTKTSTRNYY